MAKKSGYFRSSKGGRFKRTDAGDLGTRAYKDQQNEIIQALQVNKQTANYFASQQTSSLKRLGDIEQDNLRVLNQLENTIYQGKKSAISKRKETETKKLRDEAKISGQKAQWLQELAPKAAKAALELGFQSEELYSKWDADQKMKTIIEDHGGVSGILATEQAKLANEELRKKKQEALFKNDDSGFKYLDNLDKNSNRFLSLKLSKQIIANSDTIEQQIRSLVVGEEENGISRWNSEDIPQYYNFKAREIIAQFGLVGEGAQKVINHFESKGSGEAAAQGEIEELVKHTKTREAAVDATDTYKTTYDEDKGAEFRSSITDGISVYFKNPTRKGQYNRTLKGFDRNFAGAALLYANDYLSKDGVDVDGFEEDFWASCIPNANDNNPETCTKLGDKHPEGSWLRKEYGKIVDGINSRNRKKSDDTIKNNDFLAGLDWEERISGKGKYAEGKELAADSLVNGLNTEDQFNSVVKLFDSHMKAGNKKTAREIGNYIHLHPQAREVTANQQLFWQDALNENYNGALAHWNAIEPKNRTSGMRRKVDALRVLNALGKKGNDIKKESEKFISDRVGATITLGGSTLDQGTKNIIVPALQSQFNHYFNLEVEKNGGADQIIEKGLSLEVYEVAWSKAKEDLDKQDGQGIFAMETGQDGKTSFKFANVAKMGQELAGDLDINYGNIIDIMSKSGGKIDENLMQALPASLFRQTAQQILEGGKEITLNNQVLLAYEASNKKVYPSINSFVNSMLKAHGFGFDEQPLELNNNVQELVHKNIQIINNKTGNLFEDTISIKLDDSKNAVNLHVLTSIANQTGHVPILEDLLEDYTIPPDSIEFPDASFYVPYKNAPGFGQGIPEFENILRNKANKRLKLDYDSQGRIIFKRKRRWDW